jgi:hypothetical protein
MNRHLAQNFRMALIATLAIVGAPQLDADQLRYDSARDWRQWALPLGAVDLTPLGVIQPTEIRKLPDAVRNASAFDGGIRNAGSNFNTARFAIDGDPATGWGPNPEADPDEWFIEIDLGRAVSANSVTLIFDAEAPPFELFDLLISTGEPETDFIAAPIEGSLVYRTKERFKENTRHRVTYVIDEVDAEPLQFIRFEPLLLVSDARLVEVEVETIGDNIALGLLERGGGVDININLASTEQQPLGKARALFDGDLYERWRAGRASRGTSDILAHMILDLGAVYWVDQVRVIGGVVVLSGFGGGITTSHYVSRRRWGFRFYELMTSDGSLSPDGSRLWTKHFSGLAPGDQTSRGLVDHHFDLLPTRYMRIFWKYWDTNCFSLQRLGEEGGINRVPGCSAGGTTDEIQIFGHGFPQEVGFHSPLIDLGEGKNINSIEWGGDQPLGTLIEIRTRTGNQVIETYTYHDKNGKEVTEKRYGKLIPSFRGAIDTTIAAGGDWSPWSRIYSFSGEAFLSPSPRRYMEIDVRMTSDSPERAATLDFLAANFTEPLAGRVLGEIFPQETQPGVPTEFTYYLRPENTSGFDQLAVESTTPVRFMDISRNGTALDVEMDTTQNGFRLQLPSRIRTDQLLELKFESSVFRQSTRFDVFLQDSRQDEGVRQRVDPGDASDLIESNTNVVSLPVSRKLFANVALASPVITPNGDGINDELRLSVDLVNLLEPRPLRLRIYDLAGRPVYDRIEDGRAGQREFSWDGRDGTGMSVAPGLYILEILVEGDAGDEKTQEIISVAY